MIRCHFGRVDFGQGKNSPRRCKGRGEKIKENKPQTHADMRGQVGLKRGSWEVGKVSNYSTMFDKVWLLFLQNNFEGITFAGFTVDIDASAQLSDEGIAYI